MSKSSYNLETTEEEQTFFDSIIPKGMTVEYSNTRDPEEIKDCFQGKDIVISGFATPEAVKAADEMKYFIVPWAGINDRIRTSLQERKGVTLLNSHFNAPFVGEHAWALILACSKRILEYHEKLSKGDWRREMPDDESMLLHGKKLGIVGYGTIGKSIGDKAEAFGMDVFGVRRTVEERIEGNTRITGPGGLKELFATSDVVVACLPQTPETTGLIDEGLLSLMKKRAIFVNVGRGPTVDEEALYRVLKEKNIAGAGLDVWYNYPESREERRSTMPARLPFWELENVVMSPHRATFVEKREKLRMKDLAGMLENIVSTQS